MAMGMGMAGQGRHRQRSLVSDINVTPLVDVMLVLLIIFMVTAPMMTQGLDVELPETTGKALPQKQEPIVIAIDASGAIQVGQVRADIRLLAQELARLAADTGPRRPVLLKADKRVAYGVVAQVMAAVKEAGFDELGMVTRPVTRGQGR